MSNFVRCTICLPEYTQQTLTICPPLQATGMFDRQALITEGVGIQKGLTQALVDAKVALWRRQVHAARLAEIGSAAAAVLSITPNLKDDFLEGSVSILPDALQQAVWREHFVEFTVPSEIRKHTASNMHDASSASSEATASQDIRSTMWKHPEASEESVSRSFGSSPSRIFSAFEKGRKFLGYSMLHTTAALGLRPTHETSEHGLDMHGDLASRKLYILEPTDVVEAREEKLLDDSALSQHHAHSSSGEVDIYSSVLGRNAPSHGPLHGSHALRTSDLQDDDDLDPKAKDMCAALKKWARQRERDPKIMIIFGSRGDLVTNDNHAIGPTPSLRLLQHQLFESNGVATGVPSVVMDASRWLELSPEQRIDCMHAAVMHAVAPKRPQGGSRRGMQEWASPVRTSTPVATFIEPTVGPRLHTSSTGLECWAR